MPFGKHKGQPVESLPLRYLEWLADNIELHGRLAVEVSAILNGEPIPPKEPSIHERLKEIMDDWRQ